MELPPYDKFPEISSDKIGLRQVIVSDVKAIMDISFYDAKAASTIEEAIEMQNRIDIDYQKGNSIHWAIVDKSTNLIAGTLGYYRGFENGIGELGCVLKREFFGKGFMTMAMKLAIEFGLNEIGLKNIIAVTFRDNIKAIQLLERLNFEVVNNNENELKFQNEIV